MGLLDLFKRKADDTVTKSHDRPGTFVNSLNGSTLRPRLSKDEVYATYDGNWTARAAIDTLVREVVKCGYEFEPDYAAKCESCDKETDYMPTVCDCGSESFTTPDPEQLQRSNEFIDNVDPDGLDSFHDHLTQTTRDALIFDELYEQIQRNLLDEPMHLWRQDPRSMSIVYRTSGRLGGDAWFCPAHRTKLVAGKLAGSSTAALLPGDYTDDDPPVCPTCQEQCERIAYIFHPQAPSYARTTTDYGISPTSALATETRLFYGVRDFLYDTIQSSATRLLPRPLLQTAHTMAVSTMAMDIWNRDNYLYQAQPNSVLGWKGVNEAQLERVKMGVKAGIQKNNSQGRGSKSIWVTLPEKGGFEEARTLPSMVELDALKFEEYYRDAILMLFGISPQFVGVETAGKLGATGADGYQADRDTVKEIKTEISDRWDRFFKAEFGVVDFTFRLVDEEDDTSERDSLILMNKAKAIQYLNASGVPASLDPDTMEVIIDDTEPEDMAGVIDDDPPDEDEEDEPREMKHARPADFRARAQ